LLLTAPSSHRMPKARSVAEWIAKPSTPTNAAHCGRSSCAHQTSSGLNLAIMVTQHEISRPLLPVAPFASSAAQTNHTRGPILTTSQQPWPPWLHATTPTGVSGLHPPTH